MLNFNERPLDTDSKVSDLVRPEVSRDEYDETWIKDTWGWDTPENFIRNCGRNIRPRVLACLRLAAMKPGMRVLDIGCGRGEVILHCGRLGIDATGVDYSPHAIELAERTKALHARSEQNHMHFICADVKNVNFGTDFDRIFMLDVVEHLHDWGLNDLLRHCRRLLKPEGALIIHTLPNRWLYDITYKRIIRLFMPHLPVNPRTEKEMAIHVNEMSITHLTRILTAAGYESRIWLQDLIVEQARWHSKQPPSDRRGRIYQLLGSPLFSFIFKLLTRTPLRLLICNDIFAVAWKQGNSEPIKTPRHLMESFVIRRSVPH